MVLRTLGENLTETSDVVPPALPPATGLAPDTLSIKGSQGSGAVGPSPSELCVCVFLCVWLCVLA